MCLSFHGGLQRFFLLLVALAAVTFPAALRADVRVLDFEGLSDLEPVTGQYAGSGVTFQNAIALLSFPGTLNELDFPPFSGTTVLSDAGGPISLLFSSPVSSVKARFTYNGTITIAAFGIGGGVPLLTASSDPGCPGGNFVSNGNAACLPNELIALAVPSIYGLTISGNAGGGSFVMDDLTFDVGSDVVVPEPDSVFLLAAVLAVLTCTVRRYRRFSRMDG